MCAPRRPKARDRSGAAALGSPAVEDAARAPINVCVYCASHIGDDPAFADAAAAVGAALALRGADVVYGGGQVGLMGIVADAAIAGGSAVTGVITEHLMRPEVAHQGLHELVVVDGMPERKREMFDRADAFVVLPGGVGTMEEMFEVLCWGYLGLHPKPVGLLNVAGYYDHLVAFLDQSVTHGICKPRVRDLLLVGDRPTELLDRVLSAARAGEDRPRV